jgi:hypothetical protein
MSDQMEKGMAEAGRLVQEGRLAEATTVIQRALGSGRLGSGFAPVASSDAPPACPWTWKVASWTKPLMPRRLVGLPQVVNRLQPRDPPLIHLYSSVACP